ncbi:TRAP transporter small permease [Acidimangrovimonas sediminis]|uniref:TRAP transporter small permease n=1 Tax=Acidimangrovimonas sediminis TaxID=2056283 RepID=UPI000C809F8B|nr:TRAP transporter small permease [Acidimangrovimonas sediminis]
MEGPFWLGAIDRANRLLAGLAAAILVALVAIVFAGVVSRYLLGRPLLGLNEVVQLTAVALVMLGLPHCTGSGGHVTVDVLDGAIGRIGRFLGDLLSRAVSILVLSALVRRAITKALEAHEFGDVTNMLSLPLWPFYAAIALGMALSALVLAAQLVAILMRGRAA